jgi:hypothetical protein
MTPDSDTAYISWKAQFIEGSHIDDALMAWGFTDTECFELTNISLQSMLIRLDRVAEKCGVEGFKSIELDEDNENERTPVLLSSDNPKQLAAFKLALAITGGI